jgi:hypothetical protein
VGEDRTARWPVSTRTGSSCGDARLIVLPDRHLAVYAGGCDVSPAGDSGEHRFVRDVRDILARPGFDFAAERA